MMEKIPNLISRNYDVGGHWIHLAQGTSQWWFRVDEDDRKPGVQFLEGKKLGSYGDGKQAINVKNKIFEGKMLKCPRYLTPYS